LIVAKIGSKVNLLILYDSPQHQNWITKGEVTSDGLGKFYTDATTQAGIDFNEVAICCLSDEKDGKAAGFKAKEAYIQELIEVYAPNLILLPSSKAFEIFMGMKGASKFYGRVLYNEKHNCKVITMPPHSMLVYKPDIQPLITSSLRTVKVEMDFPELREEERPDKQYVMIDTIAKFRSMFRFYKENVFSFAIDTETTSLRFNSGKVILIQLSHKDHFGAAIPTPDYGAKWADEEWAEIVAGLKELIEDVRREKLVANGYFDFKFLEHCYDIKLPKENVFCVLIASFLCDENRESHSLKFCASTLLDDKTAVNYEAPLDDFKDKYCKEHKIKKSEFTYDLVPPDTLFTYSCMDVDFTFQLARYFKEELKKEEQEQVFKDVSSYAWALARIEQNGWKIDMEEAQRYKEELTGRIAELEEKIQDLNEIKAATKVLSAAKLVAENAKRKTKLKALKEPLKFLVSSPNHKRVLFKDVLRFPEVKKTKKGSYAVDKECFAIWCEKYPTVPSIKVIRELEELTKMRNTYVNALLEKSVDGRIHCSYRVAFPKTGRISALSPNLQNITMHSEESKKLRRCFTVDKGNMLVLSDLSNAELRQVAAISGDAVMSEGFKNGQDPHSTTAKSIFNLEAPVEEIKEKFNEYRQLGKVLGFSALYGGGGSLIAKRANIEVEEAERHLSEYFRKHSGIAQLFKDNTAFAKEHGYAVAISGRRRRVPYINSEDKYLVLRAERQANNFLIQSVASDCMLKSIVNMITEIDELNLPIKLINVIHDSVETEVPEYYVNEAAAFIKRHLEVWHFGLNPGFDMKCDVEVGYTWADLGAYKEESYAELAVEIDPEQEEEEE